MAHQSAGKIMARHSTYKWKRVLYYRSERNGELSQHELDERIRIGNMVCTT
jgi:hypothetical protein